MEPIDTGLDAASYMPSFANERTAASDLVARAVRAFESGSPGLACDRFREVLALTTLSRDDRVEVLVNFAAALYQAGRYADAVQASREALTISPDQAAAWTNLGIANQALQRIGDAVEAYIRAIEIDPDHQDARINLALACESLGQPGKAIDQLQAHLHRHPKSAAANYEMGRILVSCGRSDLAISPLRLATSANPDDAESWNTLGVALRRQRQTDQAIAALQKSVFLEPKHVAAHTNLSHAFKEKGDLDAAVTSARSALSVSPHSPPAMNNLASALRSQGRVQEAAELFADVESRTSDPTAGSNHLCALQYVPEINRPTLKQRHVAWAARHASSVSSDFRGKPRDEKGVVRVGFVSPDLGLHPVGYFLSGLFDALDPERVSVACYSDRRQRDGLTRRLETSAAIWRETAGVDDAIVARQIANDRVDLLVDLAGHTSSNRLQLFAKRAAPVQATWLGYVGTTGLVNIDHLFADRFHVRDGEERDYVEGVVRFPNGYLCYDPPRSPGVTDLPALKQSGVTFGAFHNPAKVNAVIVEAWAEILRQTPAATLLLKYIGYDATGTQAYIRHLFRPFGIADERLRFHGATSNYEHLRAFADIDIMLDTTPYSGGLTTCESLWMGVPVVTVPGETFAGRHATSHLNNAGYPQFVASSLEQYVALAVELANDLDQLRTIRKTMRDQVRQSHLCNHGEFAEDFTSVVHQLIRTSAAAAV